MYERFFKRLLDFTFSVILFVILSPLMILLIVIGAVACKGNPFFTQLRPGKNEKIFKLIKFKTMTDERDLNGKLLPDEKRLTVYGKFLRSTSLDELPELLNIIKGDMAFVGPRPLLVRDMTFMTDEERGRHTVRSGLTGLAQCSGRNNMTWEKRFEYDLRYVRNITLLNDVKILIKTVAVVFKKEGISENDMATATDLGDYLLYNGKISQDEYNEKQSIASEIIKQYKIKRG